MCVATTELPTAASHPFYRRLNQLLRQYGFDDFAEAQCANFYAEIMGRPGLPPEVCGSTRECRRFRTWSHSRQRRRITVR
jgi:hypothetical protein